MVKILIVDDEERQRQIAQSLLTRLNYDVDTVPSGEAAVEYLDQHQVDLIILDMIMSPGMDGFETYQNILEHHPGTKAIITSGFSENDRVKETQKLGAGTYVRKPYIMETIGMAVKKELRPAMA